MIPSKLKKKKLRKIIGEKKPFKLEKHQERGTRRVHEVQ